MATQKRKEGPRDEYRSGSEVQHLDMCESIEADLRGDASMRPPVRVYLPDTDGHTLASDEMMANYNMDMSEEDREGDDLSGDEHSSGLQGGEVMSHHRTDTGIPGDLEIDQEYEVDKREKRRPA